ncbi:MAG: efflux RND transporter periplasmic adaptor subunit [Desulfotalea sp.]
MNKVKRLIILLLILGAGGGFYYFKYKAGQSTSSDLVTLYGNIDLRTVKLAFNEQEMVEEILVDEGDKVEKGQLLAKLRDKRLVAQLLEAKAMVDAQKESVLLLVTGTRPQEIKKIEAQLVAAKTRVANAERLAKRLIVTARTGASTIQDLDNAKSERDVARAELKIVQESLALAKEGFRSEKIAEAKAILKARQAKVTFIQERLKDTSLYASAPGVIESRIMEPGEIAAPGRTVFSLALTTPKWVRAYLPEPQLGFVAQGMEAKVFSDSFPGEAFKGKVGFISSVAEFTPKFVQTTELRTQLVYETRIWLEDSENRLRLGMPVTVVIGKRSTNNSGN